jgi:3-oxoacyl-[acyl-carrier-protein] synthase-1
MIEIFSDCIISPAGFSTKENYDNVKALKSVIKIHNGFAFSKIDDKLLNAEFEKAFSLKPDSYTRLERAALLSVKKAVPEVDTASEKTAFFLSSTKGNVELLDAGKHDDIRLNLWHTAKTVSEFFGNKNTPVVISNACVSGLCAIIAAARAIQSGRIDTAVVTGADMLSKFVTEGFSSLKTLSKQPCRPFDIDRNGLNLGEAAATVVLKKSDRENYVCGSVRNDAYHISSPSKTAEGSLNALSDVLKNIPKDEIAFLSPHGTATFFNDEMESVAISKAGLDKVPVSGLKGFFGHTLGAAGVIETVLSFYALNDGTVLKTSGYETSGVSRKINVATENLKTDKKYFVKLISGFGGVNAVAVFKKN